ncbi:MAG TPA: BamA/TamA family outer membrane protein [Ohtaekwangia sp.]|uniref:translocation and assembly module lipoprotein TamL n=1 Tax=Ohtaekwangia sp. TaxID=2066019 RepID=UPI002F95CAEA
MQSKTDLRGTYRTSSLSYLLLTTVWLLVSCTGTKYLKEDEVFYNGAEINFETPESRVGRKKILRKELQTYINPKPNGRLLKARPGVWFYYIAGTPKKKKGGLRNFIRNKLGAPPVFMKETTPDRTAKILEGQLHNEGYFRSTVSQETIIKGKEGKVIYTVQLYRPFRLRSIQYPQPKDSIYKAILQSLQQESLLDTGQRFDVERMQAEQMRIEEVVENYGFYYFDNRYLVFEADSTVGKRKVDLTLKLEKDIPPRARRIYHLDQIRVFPNYSLSTDSIQTTKADTTAINGYDYIDDKHAFRPEIITDVINLKKGHIYSREAQELTLTHLMGLGAFKFVNVKFMESPRKDSSMLDANIYLTPLRKKSLRAEVQAVSKSNNFVGPGVAFTFTNRNFLRGAELFQLKLNTSYESQISRQVSGALNSFEAGLESSLTIPRFISPIRINYNSSRYLPKTQFKIGFNLQNRVSFFRINSFNAGYGYNWKESISKSHELFPIDINFVRTDKKSAAFEALLASNSVLASSFEDQFIIGTRYSYTLNTQLSESMALKYEEKKYREHNFYLNGTIDVAGNLLNTVQKTIKKGEEPYEIFNSPYSQYIRGDIDFRYYWQLDAHNKIATRIVTGIGYAYGNSTTMPYIKQFAIGGSNSIRAFPARSIGPGSYDVRSDPARNNSLFVDQRGDMKLEGNAEFRFDLIKSMKGALFVDAGNIWLLRNDSTRAGGQFHRDTFLKQLAVGTGAGLRFDFSFFILRLDVAFPLRRPNEGWVTKDIDLGSSRWRGNNLVFNIAIGYPF